MQSSMSVCNVKSLDSYYVLIMAPASGTRWLKGLDASLLLTFSSLAICDDCEPISRTSFAIFRHINSRRFSLTDFYLSQTLKSYGCLL